MSRTWMITGTSTGFGRLMTEQLLAKGDRVVATLRQPEKLQALQQRYPDQLLALTLDLTDFAALDSAVEAAFRWAGEIDVVVSNAGYGAFGAVEELTTTQIHQQLATNLEGTILFIRAVLPYLRQQGRGRLLQVSSEGGQRAFPSFSLYHASKWGIEGFIEALAQDVAVFGIECCLIEPGASMTNFGAGRDVAEAMPEYAGSAAHEIRRMFDEATFEAFGTFVDPVKVASTMVHLGERAEALPLRLPLGSHAYEGVTQVLKERLAAIEALKYMSYAAD
ncbi:SDR family oxidoreductase [Pokkaliibacter sp. CJK22405]|uniref:SDR family oxidoreductase n=1 Tax=Pokkaliibacter sp. CJK22405 TaxID=3384615 RepID=UPI003984BE44